MMIQFLEKISEEEFRRKIKKVLYDIRTRDSYLLLKYYTEVVNFL
jgi:hypothetical protein